MPIPVTIPGEGISLWVENEKLYINFDSKIRKKYYEHKAMKIICKKYKWTRTQFNIIQWDANEEAMTMFSN